MSFQTVVLQAIASIENRLNAIVANAKRIFELPPQAIINPNSKLHVDRNGTSEYLTVQQIIDSAVDSVGFINSPIEPPNYADIAAMIANQENQTPNFIQYVIDAGDDPDVDPLDPNQSRYYRYFGTTNGTLVDYELLSNTQVAVILNSPSYRQFEVKDITDSLPASTSVGQVILGKDGSDRITAVIFDATFSGYLAKYKAAFDAGKTMALHLANKTQSKTLLGIITGFDLLGGTYMQVNISTGIDNTTADVAVADYVEVFFDVDVVGEDVDLTLYMLKSIYDPTNVNGSAFSMANMVETATKKILTDVERTAIASHTTQISALTSSYARRKAVINIVNNTVAPPTEVSSDRYILDFTAGTVNANWDGAAKGSIVQFNGTVWVAEAPAEGWIVYLDTQNKDALYVDDGTPAWEVRTLLDSTQIAKLNSIRPRTTIVATGVSGTYNLDFALGIEWKINCVGATTIAFLNYTAALGESTGVYITGAVPTLPATVNVVPGSEDFDAAKRNYMVLNVYTSTASSEVVDMMNKLMTA